MGDLQESDYARIAAARGITIDAVRSWCAGATPEIRYEVKKLLTCIDREAEPTMPQFVGLQMLTEIACGWCGFTVKTPSPKECEQMFERHVRTYHPERHP